MGANYYLYERPPCGECARPFEALHIGKSSGGWCFSLHVIPEQGIHDLADWVKRWSEHDTEIRDEYDTVVSTAEMLCIVTNRSSNAPLPTDQSWYERNHCEPGPNGLVRHKVGPYCVKHGAGTWDCVSGEFS
jgi:hypothetical protein